MSNWSVTVLTPNGRRHVQRCSANTTLLQVLEQTCQKHEFKAEDYDLTHHNRVVDSSATLRFSGLPNNTFLEMAPTKKVRVESEVVLGLQLENGTRLMGTFNPSVALYEVLSSLAPDQCDLSLNPVVIYMRREVHGEALHQTTLKSLGLTGGRAILRLLHRTPEQLKIQANVSAPLPQKIKEKEASPDDQILIEQNLLDSNKETDSSEKVKQIDSVLEEVRPNLDCNKMQENTLTSVVKAESNLEKVSNKPEDDSNKMDTEDDNKFIENIIIVGERNAMVFSQEMSNHLPFNDLPDEFYDLSVSEVKKLYLELGKRRQELENVPLKTANLRNMEVDEKMAVQVSRNKNVVLRIIFPDRTVLQGNFLPLESIQIVKDFVKSYLQDSNQGFDLYITPPKTILSPDTTLFDARCVPSALVYFGPHDNDITTICKRQYLQDSILTKLSTPEAALFSASKSRGIKKPSTKETEKASNLNI